MVRETCIFLLVEVLVSLIVCFFLSYNQHNYVSTPVISVMQPTSSSLSPTSAPTRSTILVPCGSIPLWSGYLYPDHNSNRHRHTSITDREAEEEDQRTQINYHINTLNVKISAHINLPHMALIILTHRIHITQHTEVHPIHS